MAAEDTQHTGRTVAVLERDPDLGRDLRPPELALAARHAIARAVRYPKGSWGVTAADFSGGASLGLLLTDGLLMRKVTVGQRSCAELLGPGDVLQPWLQVGPDASIATEVNWTVVQEAQVAVLDRAFSRRVSRWPEIAAVVLTRVMMRVHWLSFHLSVCHLRRVDDRLLIVLWHLADRWGKVTPGGIEVRVPLTHAELAMVVGARRPSVTVALRGLIERRLVEHPSRARWVLCGDPPAEFRQLHEHAAHHERPLPEELEP